MTVAILATLVMGCVQNGRSCRAAAAAPGLVLPLPVTVDVTLCAQVIGEGPTTVVLAHERAADRRSWYPFARELAARGHRVIAFDFRGYGGSTGRRDENGVIDIRTVVDYARSTGASRVVVVGASFGGTTAVIAAHAGGIDAVASVSGPNVFRKLDAVAAATELTVPVLYAVAAADQPYTESIRQQAEQADVAPLIIDGSAHGTALVAASAELRSSLTRLVEAQP